MVRRRSVASPPSAVANISASSFSSAMSPATVRAARCSSVSPSTGGNSGRSYSPVSCDWRKPADSSATFTE